MISNTDHVFDKLSLDELIELLVKKTTEYIELMEQKNADAVRLRDLKIEIDKLHSIIAHRKSLT